MNNDKDVPAYIVVGADSILAFPIDKKQQESTVNTSNVIILAFPSVKNGSLIRSAHFTQTTFDLDILTIPFKYRFPVSDFPNQLTSNFNGAAYFGYRVDTYRLSYQKTPLHLYKRKITQYGFSISLFTGLGSTAMNPWVTNNQVSSEYDGVVFNKGLAGIVGMNNLTFGLGIGIKHLLDKNYKAWIYQGKPWLGSLLA